MNPGLFVPLWQALGVEGPGAYSTFMALVVVLSVPLITLSMVKLGLPPLKVLVVSVAEFYLGAVCSRTMFMLTASRAGAVADEVAQVGWARFVGALFASPFSDGQVYYGGLLGGVATVVVISWLWSGKDWKTQALRMLDVQAFPLVLISALGRMGCYFQGCCFGHPDAQWGVVFPSNSAAASELMGRGVLQFPFDPTPPILPTQLLEVFTSSALLVFLLWRLADAPRLKPGYFIWHALVVHAVVRFNLEWLRDDTRGGLWGLSTSQWIACFVVLGLLVFRVVLERGWRLEGVAALPPEPPSTPPRVATALVVLALSVLGPLGFGWLTRNGVLPGGLWTDTLALTAGGGAVCVWLVVTRGARGADLGLSVKGLGHALAIFSAATLMLCALGLWWQGLRARHESVLPLPFMAQQPQPATDFLIFYALVSSPAQELFYRGLLFAGLKRLGLGAWWVTVPLTALSYAGLHLLFPGIQAVLPVTFGLGLVWGVLYSRFPSVWAAAVSHAVVGVVAISMGLA